jgi:hypothetical protein
MATFVAVATLVLAGVGLLLWIGYAARRAD